MIRLRVTDSRAQTLLEYCTRAAVPITFRGDVKKL
jgi:hypothetical protein